MCACSKLARVYEASGKLNERVEAHLLRRNWQRHSCRQSSSRARPMSFFDVKGDVETLLSAFQYSDAALRQRKLPTTTIPDAPRRAVLDGVTVAQFGQLHPQIAAARKLRQDVFLAEFSLDLLYQHDLRDVRYRALPRYPAVARDFSFIFPDSVLFENMQQAVSSLGLHQLRSFSPVEVFRGGSVPAGKYSLLLRATYQSGERTLREDEVAQWSAQIAKALESLGGTQRA